MRGGAGRAGARVVNLLGAAPDRIMTAPVIDPRVPVPPVIDRDTPRRMLVQSEQEGQDGLDVAAQRLYRFGFDRVALSHPTLGYEPRSSCQCKQCAALWVGSKSGSVMRIDLRADTPDPGRPGHAAGHRHRVHEARQTFLSGNREARAVIHLHACEALTPRDRAAASFLLIGRDDGMLDIVCGDQEFRPEPPRPERHAPGAGFHLDSWAQRPVRAPVPVDGHVPRVTTGNEQTMGITAVAAIEDRAHSEAMLILVATRYPQLYILRAQAGELALCASIEMPGWIDWIVRPERQRDDVLCISRGGDIARLPLALLTRERDPRAALEPEPLDLGAIQSLSLHPTAVLPFGERGLLVGTKRGLALVRDAVSAAVAVPVTRSAVLCLDRAWMPGPTGDVHYVTMGLEDGRLRVIDAEMIDALGRGVRPSPRLHRFWVEMDASVLAVETLRIDTAAGDSSASVAFVLAILHDHSLGLFKVAGLGDQNDAACEAWRSHVRLSAAPSGADPAKDFATAWRTADELARADGDPEVCNARRYLLIEVVLAELQGLAGDRADQHAKLVDLAITLASADDPQVLRALSLAMGRITRGDVESVLALSRAVLDGLAAYRRRGDADAPGDLAPDDGQPGGTVVRPRRWATVVGSHLGELLRLARHATGDDRARLVSWARFVRKYIVHGHTFATKRKDLASLVAQNHAGGKYFDALIYQARLAQRCYDLRWELALGVGIASVHPVRFRWTRPLVVCVTSDARVIFVGPDGQRLRVRGERPEFSDAMQCSAAPFNLPAQSAHTHGWAAHHRTLTSAVEATNQGARVIVAADGDGLPPAGLAVIHVDWGEVGAGTVRVQSIEHVSCNEVAAATRVHALHPLGDSHVFVAGLESPDHAVGKLWCSRNDQDEWIWSLELAGDRRPDNEVLRDSELSAVAPGKVPTRALAAARCHDSHRYLVVAGSDDGQVRAFMCAANDRATGWRIARWDQATAAITSIALGAHDAPWRPEVAFSCYLSTAGGETLALSVVRSDVHDGRPLAGYEPVPLWRDTHDGTVIAMQLWHMPSYEDGAVLAVATQQGRLVLYNHAWLGAHEVDRVSGTMNYWFRGKRLARVSLPGPMTAVGMVEQQREVLAVCPHGRLYSASLVFLQDSSERDAPVPLPAAAAGPGPVSTRHDTDPALPPGMWAQLLHLLARSEIDWMLRPAPEERLRVKLALCRLVPIEAVSDYALRQIVEPRDHWRDHDSDQLKRRAHELLEPLDPERPADAVQIKSILRSLSRAFLSRDPDEVARAIRGRDWQRHDQTATACEIVAGYLTHALVSPTPAAARLRVVVMKELLRVGLLHHMSRQDAVADRIRNAVERALTSCLRDDNRIVRIETLRALSVMLRNVRVMAKQWTGMTHALFPAGLGSLTWALDPVVARLARFPSPTTGSALGSSAWYRISVLTHVFRLFPRRTLALCDYVTRARRGDDIVRACDDLLRRPGPPGDGEPRAFAARFELYLLRGLERGSPGGADDLARYVMAPERRRALELPGANRASGRTTGEAWYDADDSDVAERLLPLLAIMAQMWNARTADAIASALAAARARPASAMTVRMPMLASLDAAVATLIEIGDTLGRHGSDRDARDAATRGDPLARFRHTLPAGFVTVMKEILETWQTVYLQAPPSPAQRISRYQLGDRFVDDRTRLEFSIVEPPQLRDFVLRVMWQDEPIGHERFLPGARLNRRLAGGAQHAGHVVEVIDVLDDPPAYVMRRHDEWLDMMRVPSLPAHDRVGPCVRVAEDISRALATVHAEPESWHGAVKPCNIAVIRHLGRLEFRLGYFDRGYRLPGATGDATARDGVVPDYLAVRAPGDVGTAAYRRWEDVVGLLLLLFEMLTGSIVGGRCDLRSHRHALSVVPPDIAERPRVGAILALLRRLFDGDTGPITARDVVDALWPQPAPAPAPAWIMPRKLAIMCVGASPGDSELRTTTELQRIQKHLGNSAGGRMCRLIPCSGALTHIVNELDKDEEELIVHFSCHGRPGHLLLPTGQEWALRPAADIVDMFRRHGRRVRGVVLAACHADELARELVRVVDVVVYGTGGVPDPAAAAFTAFYKSLGDGETVTAACHRGNLEVREQVEQGDPCGCRDVERRRCDRARDGELFHVITREAWPVAAVRFF